MTQPTAGPLEFMVSLQDVLSDCQPLITKLRARGRIPTTARVCALQNRHLQHVHELHVENFVVPALEARRRLSGESSQTNYDLALSTALELDQRLLGFTASYQVDGVDNTVFMYGIVVRMDRRRTWAAPYLKHQTAKHLLAQGYETLGFQADSPRSDGANYARRLGV